LRNSRKTGFRGKSGQKHGFAPALAVWNLLAEFPQHGFLWQKWAKTLPATWFRGLEHGCGISATHFRTSFFINNRRKTYENQ
jgi:hypothetical protein